MSRIVLIAAAICCVPLATQIAGCAAVVGAGVVAGANVAMDRRTATAQVDDNLIEFEVNERLRAEPELWEASHVNATSFNGILLLSGEAPDEVTRERIGIIAAGVPKVRRVHNELVLAAPSSLTVRSSDTWLTGKVKTQLFAEMALEADSVKVVSEQGVVYLMGLVSEAEAHQATEIARRQGGVQRVVRLFEITA